MMVTGSLPIFWMLMANGRGNLADNCGLAKN